MRIFDDRDAQADAAAACLADALGVAGERSLVVTGGGTPGPVYDRLASQDLGWSTINVTLSDERWVDEDDEDSNAGLVRRRLLVGRAARTPFLSLKGGAATPQADALQAEARLRALLPWSAVLLGMGDDGHFASLFPGDPDLAARLDPDGSRFCVDVPVAGLKPFVPRISLTARALLETPLVVLLITGESKRALVERVAAEPDFDPPVALLLRTTRTRTLVFWAL